ERLSAAAPQLRMLRIARSGSSVVAETCKPFLVEHQLERWRREVAESSITWLRNWSRQNGLKPEEIEFGSVLKQIGGIRKRIDQLRSDIESGICVPKNSGEQRQNWRMIRCGSTWKRLWPKSGNYRQNLSPTTSFLNSSKKRRANMGKRRTSISAS